VGILLALLLAAAVVVLTAPRVFAEEEQESLAVVATLPVLGALAREIGGDRIAVEVLSHPDQDPHYVQPRPTLMKKVRKADVFIELGLGMEIWAQKVVDGAGNPRVALGQPGRIVASAGVVTIDRPTNVSRALGHIHPQGNPHIWLDPLRSRRMASTIAAGLARVAPASKESFEVG
jgi:zinc/manganese transport system substrate-binding protein